MKIGATIFASWVLIALFMATASANGLVADLSKDHISIRSNFSGETLLLFGAVGGDNRGRAFGASVSPIDVVVVLRGPAANFTIRKKARRAGIWVNSEVHHISDLPAFYALVSTNPIDAIVPEAVRAKHKIGIDNLRDNVPTEEQSDGRYAHAQDVVSRAFMRLRAAQGLYSESESGVELIGGRLFRAEINLPPGMPIGSYVSEFFAFQDGRLIGYQTGELPVDTVGAGHVMYELAHTQPLLYGLGGVALAACLGWAAALMFRRRS